MLRRGWHPPVSCSPCWCMSREQSAAPPAAGTSAFQADQDAKDAIQLVCSWKGKSYDLTLSASRTVGDLKRRVGELTNVLPKRQKLMGLVKGRAKVEDEQTLAALKVASGTKFMMMGAPEAEIFVDASQLSPEELPDVVNDLDYDYFPDHIEAQSRQDGLKKLEKRLETVQVHEINPLREGKKLLVLDLDYTLFDMKTTAENIGELMRPGMHEFLAAMYEHFDLVIWSQTSWKWLEMKITELGILTSPHYKLAFVLDQSSMFAITHHAKDKEPKTHEIKPLEFIWRKYPRFSKKNTLHVDDLSRNFAWNPENGIKISAYRNAHSARATDRELIHLGKYLMSIVDASDFSKLDHRHWKKHRSI